MPGQFTLPPDPAYANHAGRSGDANNLIRALVALGAGCHVAAFGAVGDGVTDDTAAIQAALNAAQPGQTVLLSALPYLISAPLVIPPYVGLAGPPSTSQVSSTRSGAVLVISSGFTALTITDGGSVNLAAAIVLLGQPFGTNRLGGYATVSEEQHVRDVMIDGTSAPASTHGILSYGRLQRVQLERVLIAKVTGDGVQHNLDVAGNQPDGWNLRNVFVRFNGGRGFVLRSADSTYINCLTSNTGSDGWVINTESNSKFIGCRSEHAGGLGFGYVCRNNTNSSGGTVFVGCSTDQSTQHGFQIGGTINGVTSFAVSTPVVLAGCNFRRDGANGGAGGGSFAGLYDAAYGGQVVVSGLGVFPGLNDDGSGTNSPQIGVLLDSGSKASLSGSFIHAATTAITDNSGGGLNLDNSVVTATGSTNSPTVVAAPGLAAYQGASLSLTPPSAPGSDPLFITNQNAGERAFGLRVQGQGNDRWKITSSGTMSWGPGSATQDVSLARVNGNQLQVQTGDLDIVTAGRGLQIAEGSNAKMGTATLSAGTVVVSTTAVTANSRIYLTAQTSGAAPGALRVSARTAGTSFTITSTSGTDTSSVAWLIVEPG
jgi:hypothetical protein